MAREASPAAKRAKQEAVRRKEAAVISAHCARVGVPVPEAAVSREADGRRVGYLEMSGNAQEDRYMQALLTQEGAEVVAVPAEKRFRILWSDEKLRSRQQSIWDKHANSRRKTESDGGPIQQESAEVTHALLDEIDRFLGEG